MAVGTQENALLALIGLETFVPIIRKSPDGGFCKIFTPKECGKMPMGVEWAG